MWNKFLNLFTILTLVSLLIAPVGSASAQESDPSEKKIPLSFTGYNPAPPNGNTTPGASGILPIIGNLVQDPSFEASFGSPTLWAQSSTNAGTPLCAAGVSNCPIGGDTGPRTGNVWAWFGGINFSAPNTVSPEIGKVLQNVTFPSCGATLEFYFWIGFAAAGSDANDFFAVFIDDNAVFVADATEINSYSFYTLVSRDVSSFADGAVHQLMFYSSISDQLVNMNLDDVSLIRNCPTISGNAGVAGASFTYTGGSTSAGGGGNYSFNGPPG